MLYVALSLASPARRYWPKTQINVRAGSYSAYFGEFGDHAPRGTLKGSEDSPRVLSLEESRLPHDCLEGSSARKGIVSKGVQIFTQCVFIGYFWFRDVPSAVIFRGNGLNMLMIERKKKGRSSHIWGSKEAHATLMPNSNVATENLRGTSDGQSVGPAPNPKPCLEALLV